MNFDLSFEWRHEEFLLGKTAHHFPSAALPGKLMKSALLICCEVVGISIAGYTPIHMIKKLLRLFVSFISLASIPVCSGVDTTSELSGETAPDFELVNHDGKPLKLSDFQGKNGVVLVFSRAHWCPYCMRQLRMLSDKKAEFEAEGFTLVSVLREEKAGMEGVKKALKLSKNFPNIVVDSPVEATKAYKHEDYGTYIIDKSGKVRALLTGPKAKRPTADEILKAVKSL